MKNNLCKTFRERRFVAWTIVLIAAFVFVDCADAQESSVMLEMTLRGKKIEGTPLHWNEEVVHLLGRDGKLWEFPPEEAEAFKKTADQFRPYNASEFRAVLLRELGGDYEVSGTGHYMIAHPRGQRDKWAERFEQLYRSFVQFFSVRGFTPQNPPFPLVGIVCKNHDDFRRFSAAGGDPVPNGVLGYYDQISNRIMLYDTGNSNRSLWQETASVILHESTHQTAFNVGIHSRYAPPPVWVAEGLAMMFETPGVYDAAHHPNIEDRVNRGRLLDFRQGLESKHKSEWLKALVASDDIFRLNASAAYAESWAFSFFLAETEPKKYVRYLGVTASRSPFTEYTPQERLNDFTAIFGGDWKMLEARFLRFLAGVK